MLPRIYGYTFETWERDKEYHELKWVTIAATATILAVCGVLLLWTAIARAEDTRLYSVVYAEVGGGSPVEVQAVSSVFINRINRVGLEKALRGSSAYLTKSKEYRKAQAQKFTAYEKKIYLRNKLITKNILTGNLRLLPYYYFENIKVFGTPKWSRGLEYQDIGRQRFYMVRR